MIRLDFAGNITFIASLPTQETPPYSPSPVTRLSLRGAIGTVKHPRRAGFYRLVRGYAFTRTAVSVSPGEPTE